MSVEPTRQRALQAAYCDRHQLRYDPHTAACPLCRRDQPPQAPASTRGIPLVPLLGGLSLLVLLAVLWPRSPAGSPTSGVAARGPSASVALPGAGVGDPYLGEIDPTPFRTEIEALEELLYAPRLPLPGSGRDVLAAARRLSERLIGAGRELAGRDVSDFGDGVGREESLGSELIDLPRARGYWEALRRQHFRRATWFRLSAPQLDEQQRPPQDVADPTLVAALERAADQIQELIHDGRRRAFEVGEVTGEGDPQRRLKESAWTAFSRDWDRWLSERLPPLPDASSDPTLLQVAQALGRALNELRLIPHTAYSWTGVPAFYEREGHLDAAQAAIAEARRLLESRP